MTQPDNSAAPERIWLHSWDGIISDKPDRWWEYQDYVREDIAEAQLQAAVAEMRDRCADMVEREGHSLHVALRYTPTPTDALERAIEAAVQGALPETLTAPELADACLSYRHDYGLMSVEDREAMRWQAAEWFRCLRRAIVEPSAAAIRARSDAQTKGDG